MIELVERNLEAFFKTPFNIYPSHSPYVSPMKSDLARFLSAEKNPLFANDEDFTFFTIHQNGEPAGRITAHVHRASNERHGTNRANFGFFDCADDPRLASTLLGAAENWAKVRGYSEIAGNFNLTAMQQIGVQTEGYENAVYTDQVWSPPHTAKLLESQGYQRQFPMTTFEQDIRKIDPEMLIGEDQRAVLREGNFRFASVNRRTLTARLDDARTILNESFIANPMFVPVSKAEFDFQSKEMKWIMDPRISTVMYKGNTVAGAVIAIPDLNPMLQAMGSRLGLSAPWHFLKHRLKRKRAVVIFQGVRPSFQGMGVNPLMLSHILGNMKNAGYETVGGTWIADENTASLRQVEKGGARPLHRLHLFSKAL